MSVDSISPRKMPRNKVIFYALCIVATLILIAGIISVVSTKKVAVTFDSGSIAREEDGRKLIARDIEVTPGIYQITIDYLANEDVRTEVKVREGAWRDLLTDDPTLKNFKTNTSFKVWASDTCKKFDIELTSDGDFSVNEISVITASNSSVYRISVMVFFYLVAVAFLAAVLLFREQISRNSFALAGIGVITLVSSVGFFVTYLYPGHDINFHMLRIDGLADAISAGNFPDRVQTNWCYDWGYCVSAMYGDTTLILPAIMRLLGFPLVTSYKVFAVLVNLGTAVCSYKVFEKIGGNKKIALFVAFLYTCSPYRMCCVYLRSAVGEYTAMMFLPLILLVIKYIYYEDINSGDYGKKLLVPALALAMLIQTHILTCVMLSISVVLFAVIQFRKTFRKKTLIYIGKIVLFAALISLWFIIPLLRFYHEPLLLQSNLDWKDEFHYYGVTFGELLAQRSSPGAYFNFAFNTSLSNRMPLMLGNGFVLIIGAALFFIKKVKIRADHIAVGVITFIALMMATIYFPYNLIHSISAKAGKFLSTVQFPYRYLTITTILLSVIALFAVKYLFRTGRKTVVYILLAASLLVCFDQSMSVIYLPVYKGDTMNEYDGAGLDPVSLIGYEYLYDRSDIDATMRDTIPNSENTVINAVYRDRNSFDITVSQTGSDAYVEAPVFAYPGYTATSKDTGEKLEIVHGSNNKVRVNLEQGFAGTVQIRYKDLPIWNIAEAVSVLTLAFLILRPYIIQFITKKKKVNT